MCELFSLRCFQNNLFLISRHNSRLTLDSVGWWIGWMNTIRIASGKLRSASPPASPTHSPSLMPGPWPAICGCTATTVKWTSSQPCGWVRAMPARIRNSKIHLLQLLGRTLLVRMTTCWYLMFYWSPSMWMAHWISGRSALLTSPSFPLWWVLPMQVEPVDTGSEPILRPVIRFCLCCYPPPTIMSQKNTTESRAPLSTDKRRVLLRMRRVERVGLGV